MHDKSLPTAGKQPLSKAALKQNKSNVSSKWTFRFCKNKNIIQTNKQRLETTRYFSSLRQTTCGSPTHESWLKKQLQTSRSSNRFESNSQILQKSNFSRIELFKHHHSSPSYFSPRNKSKIMLKYNTNSTLTMNKTGIQKSKFIPNNNSIINNDNELNNDKSASLSRLLRKNKLYGQRCLVGMNIPKIQQAHQFSRFELFNLHSHYKTLIQTAQSLQQMRKGFQKMHSSLIDEIFSDFSHHITFSNFIKVYASIQNIRITQNIIEYMKQVFSSFYREEMIPAERVLETLRDKMEEIDAIQIKKIIYHQLNYNCQSWEISLGEIVKACQQNIHLCRRIFHSMERMSSNNRLSQK